MKVLNKSHFSLQMGNCLIPVVEHSGQGSPYSRAMNVLHRIGVNDALFGSEALPQITKEISGYKCNVGF